MFRKFLIVPALLTALLLLGGLAAPSAQAALLTPTPTISVTATPLASPTPTPAAAANAPASFDAWCLPDNSVITHADLEKTTKAENALAMKQTTEGAFELTTPNDGCLFTFTFSQTPPEGLKLEVYDATNVRWLSSALKPSDAARTLYTTLTHTYIVNPPFWWVSYTLKLVDAAGAVLWSSPVTLRRGYEPGKCWDGTWPDFATFQCYYPPDAHPWDAWYKAIPPKP